MTFKTTKWFQNNLKVTFQAGINFGSASGFGTCGVTTSSERRANLAHQVRVVTGWRGKRGLKKFIVNGGLKVLDNVKAEASGPGPPKEGCSRPVWQTRAVQGHLAHKKEPPPRTLH